MITDRDEFIAYPEVYLSKIKKGVLFIYPTDTIYGIGCDATIKAAVDKLRKVTGKKQPLSVIAPNKQWIKDNFVMTQLAKENLRFLPGGYTLIMKIKKGKRPVAANVGLDGKVGVRMLDHWMQRMVRYYNKPIITTSANVSCGKNMTSLKDLDKKLLKAVDFVVDEGLQDFGASEVIDVSGKTKKIVRKKAPGPKNKKVIIYRRQDKERRY